MDVGSAPTVWRALDALTPGRDPADLECPGAGAPARLIPATGGWWGARLEVAGTALGEVVVLDVDATPSGRPSMRSTGPTGAPRGASGAEKSAEVHPLQQENGG